MATIGIGGFGDFLSDAWDATGGQVVDVATSAIDNVPGIEWVRELVDGPLKDFANSAVGKVVLRALASSVTGGLDYGLGQLLGPQLATIAWAFPGMLAGDSFTSAWTQEFAWRASKVAEILGAEFAAVRFPEQVKSAFAKLGELGAGAAASITDRALAAATGAIREDMAALALDMFNKTDRFRAEDYDDATGRRHLVPSPSPFLPSVGRSAAARAVAAAIHATHANDWYQAKDAVALVNPRAAITAALVATPAAAATKPRPRSVSQSAPEVVAAVGFGTVALVGVATVGVLGALAYYLAKRA